MASFAPGTIGPAQVYPPYPAALIVSGSQWQSPLAQGGQILLAKPEVHIGRMAGNDLVLADERASRMHAAIRWSPQGYVLQDAGSANGTFVNDQRITQPLLLSPGQRIGIGDSTLLFQPIAPPIHAPAPPPPQPPPPQPPPQSEAAPSAQVVPQPAPAPQMNAPPAPAVRPFPSTVAKNPSWITRQKGRRWWQILLAGVVAYIILRLTLFAEPNPILVPMIMLLGAATVPIAFVRYCWEEGAFADMPLTALIQPFVWSAVVALPIAALLETFTAPGSGIFSMFGVGLTEETCKAAAAVWATRKMRVRSQIDGLVIGAAAGMGFAALETAGYGFSSFLTGFHDGGFATGAASMNHELIARMVLAVFGHGVWTAILCAAIWRERGDKIIRFTRGVLLAWVMVVTLHALWDRFIDLAGYVSMVLVAVIVGGFGIYVLRFFIKEGVVRSRLGPAAPPPPPLGKTLLQYLFHQPIPEFQAAGTSVDAVPTTVSTMDDPDRPGESQQDQPSIRCLECGATCPGFCRFCWNCGEQLPRRSSA